MKKEPLNIEYLHIALSQALEDLKAIEDNPNYQVMMGVWHAPDFGSSRCNVCLAGSVMANRMGTSKLKFASPATFSREMLMLMALNKLRTLNLWDACLKVTGHGLCDELQGAYAMFEIERSLARLSNEDAIEYHTDRDGFHAQMQKLVKLLKEYDL